MTRWGPAATLLAAVVIGATAAGCGGESEAEALCGRLDGGMDPAQAVSTLPGSEQDPMGAILRAIDYIRSTCRQHNDAAASLEFLLDSQPPPLAGGGPDAIAACVAAGRGEQECQEAAARTGQGG